MDHRACDRLPVIEPLFAHVLLKPYCHRIIIMHIWYCYAYTYLLFSTVYIIDFHKIYFVGTEYVKSLRILLGMDFVPFLWKLNKNMTQNGWTDRHPSQNANSNADLLNWVVWPIYFWEPRLRWTIAFFDRLDPIELACSFFQSSHFYIFQVLRQK